jgi:hypothetical protein
MAGVVIAGTFVVAHPGQAGAAGVTPTGGSVTNSLTPTQVFLYTACTHGDLSPSSTTCQHLSKELTGVRQPVVAPIGFEIGHVSVSPGLILEIHFNHRDVTSTAFLGEIGDVEGGLSFACGLLAFAIVAAIACEALVIILHQALMYGFEVAANYADYLPDYAADLASEDGLQPILQPGEFASPYGWIIPIYETGLTIGITFFGTYAGARLDDPACPC